MDKGGAMLRSENHSYRVLSRSHYINAKCPNLANHAALPQVLEDRPGHAAQQT